MTVTCGHRSPVPYCWRLPVTIGCGVPAPIVIFTDVTVEVALLLLGNGENFGSFLGFL